MPARAIAPRHSWAAIAATVSSSFMALSHGSIDAQKVMGIITMALICAGYYANQDFHVPMWLVICCSTAMALGLVSAITLPE